MDNKNKRRRNRRRHHGVEEKASKTSIDFPKVWGVSSLWTPPLNHNELTILDGAVKEILSKTGLSEAPEAAKEIIIQNGGQLDQDNRLLFPIDLVSRFLDEVPRGVKLCGREPDFDMECSGRNSYLGSGGASPNILDIETQSYRETKLSDIYDAARLVDRMENIHFFSRPMVARDMLDEESLDINTAYACLKGTRKHIMTSITNPHDVSKVAEMCFIIAGSKEAFLERPFLSLNINHSVSPLRFDSRSAEVIIEAARIGIPIQANTFSQVGASTSVSIASAVAQTSAETFSGMILAWLVNPNVKVIFGGRPMITDLRTGALSGGGGEQAFAMSYSAQLAQYYGLSNSCIAGATDSKLPDSQSGYEKGISVLMAALAGSNLITQACGTQASLMGTALESYLIDNDMAGVVLRSIHKPEFDRKAVCLDIIDRVVRSEGHFLGDPETYSRMRSDYLYPQISNRDSIEKWESEGKKSVYDIAKLRVKEILSTDDSNYISKDADKKIRALFEIHLN